MRVIHRYLGFFLAGIMAMYALSGMVLIFRDTDFLKNENKIVKEVEANLSPDDLGKQLKIRELKANKTEGGIMYFNQGTYEIATGKANYTTKELPKLLNNMTKLHKASTKSPLYYLNIFFGLSLLFFVVSSFFMFAFKTKTFKTGLYYTVAGVVLTLILLMF